FLSASSLLGLRSFASILPDTSIAITISIPLVVLFLLSTSTLLGLARATIIALNASILNPKSTGLSFASMDDAVLKPFSELIFNSAVCCFLFQMYQPMANGSNVKSQKKAGCKKVTSFILDCLFKFYRFFNSFQYF